MIGIREILSPIDKPFAKLTPVKSAPARPGPWVTAIASKSPSERFASDMASFTIELSISSCTRDAISGTTPPKEEWTTCEPVSYTHLRAHET